MKRTIFFLLSCLMAALIPLLPTGSEANIANTFPANWPRTFDGKQLVQISISDREKRFLAEFPGHMAKFTDGNNEILIRHVFTPTRKLHPSMHCYKGFGFTIVPKPLWTDKSGQLWGCFVAQKKNSPPLVVKEQIVDPTGKVWTDVSAWYWSAVLGRTKGPWQAFTIAEPEVKEDAS
ncbi:MAG: hypothetical protein KCHDKBKB_02910 [Elusimicrobia bacterium]|nr:hypothetical protein [Elusimicrobiota bacterium]